MNNEEKDRIFRALKQSWQDRGEIIRELAGSDQPDLLKLIDRQNTLVNELMEALKSAQHFIGNGAVNMAGAWRDSVLDQIEDAIAKAEGGQK